MPVNLRDASLPVRRAIEEHGGQPQPPLTYVYFVQPEGGGPIKIGRADDPVARRGELQVGNWHPLRLTRCVVAPPLEEQRLHEVFAELRLNGEWFRAHPLLAAIADGIPDPDSELALVAIRPSGLDPAARLTRMEEYGRRFDERWRRMTEGVIPMASSHEDTITYRPEPDAAGWRDSSALVLPS